MLHNAAAVRVQKCMALEAVIAAGKGDFLARKNKVLITHLYLNVDAQTEKSND